MFQSEDVTESAERLYKQKDAVSLEILIGLRAKAIELDPALKDDVKFEPKYESATMGALDDVKALGRRILNRWNQEFHRVVCENKDDDKDRKAILYSLNLDEYHVVAAVVGALLSLGVGAALAVALAPLIVKRFVWPAREELCESWGESLKDV